jgi:hypothetical protein
MGELSDLIKRLRSGAATNESEEKFYLGQLPGAMDKLSENLPFGLAEPGLVEDKLNLHKNLFNGVIQQWGNRAVGGWPTSPTATAQDFGVDPSKVEKPNVGDWVPRFDKQEAAKNKNATPSTPLPNGPDTKIEVKAPDGQIGHLTQKQIDAAKKEGVIFTPTKK